MYTLEILIGTGICALVVGGLLGMMLGRNSNAGAQQARELEKRLEQLNRDKQAYEDRVSEHFVETATRLNTLTETYRGIHEHLAEGASTLCLGKTTATVLRLGGTDEAESKTADSEVPQAAMNVEPPRDYAPKSSPSDPGMLNESFGLDRESAPERTEEEYEDVTETQESDVSDADDADADDAEEDNKVAAATDEASIDEAETEAEEAETKTEETEAVNEEAETETEIASEPEDKKV